MQCKKSFQNELKTNYSYFLKVWKFILSLHTRIGWCPVGQPACRRDGSCTCPARRNSVNTLCKGKMFMLTSMSISIYLSRSISLYSYDYINIYININIIVISLYLYLYISVYIYVVNINLCIYININIIIMYIYINM